MENTKTNNNWPDAPRLKMIERSEFYGDSARVYQYGFYDGFQYRNKEVSELLAALEDAKDTLQIIAQVHPAVIGDSLAYDMTMKKIESAIKKATT